MRNEILRKRIIHLIAMSYALKTDDLWNIYERLGNLEKLLNLLETDTLQQIMKEIK